MPPVIRTERLTKAYGVHRGITELDLEVAEGEIFGFLGPNGAGKTTTMRDPARPDPADLGTGRGLRHRDDRRPGRDPPSDRLPAGRVRPVRPADRRPDDHLLREPARRRRPGVRRGARRAARPRPEPPLQGVLEGQQAEGRPDRRAPAPARPADPGRADVRPRSARPADVLRASSARRARRAGRSSCRATSSTRSTGPATGSRSSARAGSSRSTRSRPSAGSPSTTSS